MEKNIRIILALVKSDFTLRYQGTILGYFWTIIKPLMLFGVIYLVFSIFMRYPLENYAIYLLIGILIWNYFAEATLIGIQSLETKRNLITKLYFPLSLIIISSTISSTITLILNLIILIVFLIIAKIQITFISLFFLIYILELYLIVAGITFLLTTMYTYFHDIKHIWEILLQIGFWLTPIIYPIKIVPYIYHQLIFLNPLARIIEYSRDIIINQHIPSLHLNIVILLMTLTIFFSGYIIFNKNEKKIAERL